MGVGRRQAAARRGAGAGLGRGDRGGVAAPEPKGQPADLTEILRASVAAAKGGRGKSDDKDSADKDSAGKDRDDAKPAAKPKPRRKASA